jgi:hypothetical protein
VPLKARIARAKSWVVASVGSNSNPLEHVRSNCQ